MSINWECTVCHRNGLWVEGEPQGHVCKHPQQNNNEALLENKLILAEAEIIDLRDSLRKIRDIAAEELE